MDTDDLLGADVVLPIGVLGVGHLVDPLGMMTAGPVATLGPLDDRRLLRGADLGRDRTPVDVDARGQRVTDLGQVARDGEQLTVGLAEAATRDRVEQALRVGVARRLEHLVDVAGLDHTPRVHHADAVTHRADDAEVVGNEEDGGVELGSELADEVEHLGLDRGIETRRRLVEHQQGRLGGQRHRDHDTLQHAARQLVRIALGDTAGVGDAHLLERLIGARPRGLLGVPHDLEALGHLLADLQHRIHRLHGVLIDHRRFTGPELAEFLAGHVGEDTSTGGDTTVGDPPVARQVSERSVCGGGLSTARLADQAEGLAGLDLEADAAQHFPRRAPDHVGHLEILDLEGGLGFISTDTAHERNAFSIESATRLTAITRLAIASDGKIVGHQMSLPSRV